MKKFFAAIFAVLMLLSLTACGDVEKAPESKPDSDSFQESSSDEVQKEPEKVEFEEITVVDNDECVIKITGIKEKSIWGYTLNAYLENKSSEKTYMFSVENAFVNGVESNPLFASEVVAGKKATGEISFSNTKLEENGITRFTDIEIAFRVYDSDDWSADNVAEETVHIYPYGKDKAELFVREAKDTDNVIVDNEYVTIILTGYEKDSIWGYCANLFLVNKSDTEVMFSVDDVSVNGYMVDPFWASSVCAGKCAFSEISWSNSSLEKNNITEIEQIELTFKARDNETILLDDLASAEVTLNP